MLLELNGPNSLQLKNKRPYSQTGRMGYNTLVFGHYPQQLECLFPKGKGENTEKLE